MAQPDVESPPTGDVASLLRGLAVLEAVVARRGASTPKEISEATGLDRSTVQRLLRTLLGAGYLRRIGRGDYGVGPAALTLGWNLTQSTILAELAVPILTALRDKTGTSTNMAVLDQGDIVYVGRVEVPKPITLNVTLGTRLPAYCTALGRAILAWLPPDRARAILDQSDRRQYTPRTVTSVPEIEAELSRVRARGYAIDDQEFDLGIRSIAAPVFSADHRPVASINVSATSRLPLDSVRDDFAPALLQAAEELSSMFGGTGSETK